MKYAAGRKYIGIFLILFSWQLQARPKVGLALSGGGARGFAHVGVLKFMQAQKIPIDYITGTSMGALIAALYSTGYSVEEIESLVVNTEWTKVFNDDLSRSNYIFQKKEDHQRYLLGFEAGFSNGQIKLPPGVLTGQKLSMFLQSLTYKTYNEPDFSKFPIPFCAFATNIVTGKPVAFSRGNLGRVLYASMAYPGIVSPIEINGQLLIDGYFSNNVPVSQLKEMGADITVGVDISSPYFEKDKSKNFVSISAQSINILVKQISKAQLDSATFSVVPELLDIATTDFSMAKETISMGEASAYDRLIGLIKYRVSDKEFDELEKKRKAFKHQRDTKIDRVVVWPGAKINKKFIVSRIKSRPGDIFKSNQVEQDLNSVYGWADFERVEYYLDENPKKETVLNISSQEKSWGPNYLRIGLQFDSEKAGTNEFIGVLNFTMNHLNRLGGIWRNDIFVGDKYGISSEFYQPLRYGSPLFLRGNTSYLRTDQNLFSNEQWIDEYVINSSLGSLKAGITLGRNSEIAGGVYAQHVFAGPYLSTSSQPHENNFYAGYVGHVVVDRINDRSFPNEGFMLQFNHQTSGFLGSDRRYHKSSLLWDQYVRFFRGAFFLQTQAGTSYNSDLPYFDEFTLGGVGSFSGLRREETRGSHLAAGRLGYTFPILKRKMLLFRGIHLSLFSDIGSTWNSLDDISSESLMYGGGMEVGFDTKLFPVKFGYGQISKEQFQLYLRIGPQLSRRFM